MEKVIFETEIIRCGCDAIETLDANLFVLFGKEVPPIIDDIAFIHNNNVLAQSPKIGDIVDIDGEKFKICNVGELVYQNLSELGHCTFQFGEEQEILSGSISIHAPKVPEIKIHTKIKILSQ